MDDIKYSKLRAYITDYHPTRKLTEDEHNAADRPEFRMSEEVRFGICEYVGTLNPCAFCKMCTAETSAMAKQIGIGPAVFLMSTRAFAYFFVWLTILNLPIFYYYKGEVQIYGAEAAALQDTFQVLSLAHVKESDDATKQSLGLVIIFVDFLVIVSFLLFTWALNSA